MIKTDTLIIGAGPVGLFFFNFFTKGIPNKIFKDAETEDSKAWKHSNKIEDDEYVSEYALHEPCV